MNCGLFLLVLAVCVAASCLAQQRRVQYQHFDEYLVSVVASPDHHNQGVSGDRGAPTTSTLAPRTQSTEQILGYFRDMPREHWSCCLVGRLAGNKGFHCHAGFYAARVRSRNYNRAHSRRLPLHQQGQGGRWGMDIMRSFNRCVTHQMREFHRCCYVATVEQQELSRYEAYINGRRNLDQTEPPRTAP